MGALHRTLPWLVLVLGGFALWWVAPARGRASARAAEPQSGNRSTEPRPSPALPDAFYPGFDARKDKLPAVRDGGRVVVHSPGFPSSLNYMIENSAVTRRMWGELHEGLLRQDPVTWEYVPALAESFEVQDQLVLEGGDVKSGDKVLVGHVTDMPALWNVVDPGTSGTQTVAKGAGQRLLRGTVYEFRLRKGVKWQDGTDFDARDVMFSMRCFRNPHVPCDQKRYQFEKLARFDSAGRDRVRFVFAEPYFLAPGIFDGLTILPAHLYDLSDERNPRRKPGATDEEQARFIEEHPANRQWIGLGPYKLVEWSDNAIVARRWDGYWDRARAGHVDEIVWRLMPDAAAVTGLLEGELDYFDRLSGEDYFGGKTANPSFDERYYKGYSYGPQISFVAWNMKREKLSDARVRTALGMCFDWDGFIKSYYKGLARRVTGDQFVDGPMYDATLEPLPFDLERARALLAEAGWADHDKNGIVDKGGTDLRIDFLYSGDRTSELLGQAFQANLKKIGVELALQSRDWTAMSKLRTDREFDAVSMGWITPPVVDPEQKWHSRWVGPGGENNSGLADADVDRLIGEIQVELDPGRQKTLFANLQRRIYALQPCMFGVNVPRKFAMAKRVRNLECFVLDPGYSIRRWFVVDPAKK